MPLSKDSALISMVATLALLAPFPALGQTPAPLQTPAPAAAPKVAPAPDRGTISVRIEGLRNNQGTVYVSLFDNKKAFEDNKAARVSGQARPEGGTCVLVFENIPPGRYALNFIHDENDNKKLDTNFIGIPKEGFGYSRDAMGRFGPPGFEAAALLVPAGVFPVVMRAKYM